MNLKLSGWGSFFTLSVLWLEACGATTATIQTTPESTATPIPRVVRARSALEDLGYPVSPVAEAIIVMCTMFSEDERILNLKLDGVWPKCVLATVDETRRLGHFPDRSKTEGRDSWPEDITAAANLAAALGLKYENAGMVVERATELYKYVNEKILNGSVSSPERR